MSVYAGRPQKAFEFRNHRTDQWWQILEPDAFQEADVGHHAILLIAEDLLNAYSGDARSVATTMVSWIIAQAWLRAKRWQNEHKGINSRMTTLSRGLVEIIRKAGMGAPDEVVDLKLDKIAKALWKEGLSQYKFAHADLETLLLADRTSTRETIIDALDSLTIYLEADDAELVRSLQRLCEELDDSLFQEFDAILGRQEKSIHVKLSTVEDLPERIEEFIDNLGENAARLQVLTSNGRFPPLCVTDLMLMERLLDNLPYATRDLKEYFENVTPLSAMWDELEFQTMISISLKDERAKNLVGLYEDLCDWRTPVYLGLLSLQNGQLRQARHHFELWTETRYGKSEYSAFNNLAVITSMIGKGKKREALRIIDQAIDMNPDDPHLWTNKGMFLIDFWLEGQDESFLKEAVKMLERAISLDSENVQAHLGMGTIHFEREESEEALKHFEQVLPHMAEDTEILTMTGMILQRMYREEKDANVLEQYCKVLGGISRVNPEYPGVWYTLGYSLQMTRNSKEARKAYLKAVEYEGEEKYRAMLYSNIGVSYSNDGDWDQAEEMLRKASEEDPNSPEISYNLATLLHKQGRHPKALDYYLGALRSKEDYPRCLYNLGNLLESLGLIDRAIKAYRNCRNLDESHLESRVRLGSLLASANEFQEAEIVLLEAISLSPDDGRVWEEVGRLMDVTGKSYFHLPGIGTGPIGRDEVGRRTAFESEKEYHDLAGFEEFGFDDKEMLLKPP